MNGHQIYVTPVGPRWVGECTSCGVEHRFAGKRAANEWGMAHQQTTGPLLGSGPDGSTA